MVHWCYQTLCTLRIPHSSLTLTLFTAIGPVAFDTHLVGFLVPASVKTLKALLQAGHVAPSPDSLDREW